MHVITLIQFTDYHTVNTLIKFTDNHTVNTLIQFSDYYTEQLCLSLVKQLSTHSYVTPS